MAEETAVENTSETGGEPAVASEAGEETAVVPTAVAEQTPAVEINGSILFVEIGKIADASVAMEQCRLYDLLFGGYKSFLLKADITLVVKYVELRKPYPKHCDARHKGPLKPQWDELRGNYEKEKSPTAPAWGCLDEYDIKDQFDHPYDTFPAFGKLIADDRFSTIWNESKLCTVKNPTLPLVSIKDAVEVLTILKNKFPAYYINHANHVGVTNRRHGDGKGGLAGLFNINRQQAAKTLFVWDAETTTKEFKKGAAALEEGKIVTVRVNKTTTTISEHTRTFSQVVGDGNIDHLRVKKLEENYEELKGQLADAIEETKQQKEELKQQKKKIGQLETKLENLESGMTTLNTNHETLKSEVTTIQEENKETARAMNVAAQALAAQVGIGAQVTDNDDDDDDSGGSSSSRDY